MTSYSVLNVLCAPSYDNSVRKLGLYSTFYRGENRGFFFFFYPKRINNLPRAVNNGVEI